MDCHERIPGGLRLNPNDLIFHLALPAQWNTVEYLTIYFTDWCMLF